MTLSRREQGAEPVHGRAVDAVPDQNGKPDLVRLELLCGPAPDAPAPDGARPVTLAESSAAIWSWAIGTGGSSCSGCSGTDASGTVT